MESIMEFSRRRLGSDERFLVVVISPLPHAPEWVVQYHHPRTGTTSELFRTGDDAQDAAARWLFGAMDEE